MSKNTFTVCSLRTAARMQEMVAEIFERDRYAVFSWRTGPLSSMPQLALFHIWLKKWAAHALHKPEADVSPNELAGMKRSVKARYYHETSAPWMVETIADPLAPGRTRTDYTSAAAWEVGEMFAVMEWMQLKAAEQGLVLEAIGEYQKNKTEGIS